MHDLTLPPLLGLVLLIAMLLCGRQFRENWKAQDAGWQRRAWLYGIPVTLCFMVLAFVPLRIG